jgi:hypothetical protein
MLKNLISAEPSKQIEEKDESGLITSDFDEDEEKKEVLYPAKA